MKEEIPQVNDELYQLIVNEATVGIAIHDVTDNVRTVFSNKYWEKHSGYSKAEILEMGEELFFRAIHPDDEQVLYEMKDFLANNHSETYSGFHRFKKKNGNWIWIFGVLKVIERNRKGLPVKILAFAIDFSEKIRTHPQVEFLLKENLRLKNSLKIQKLTKRQLEVLKLIAKGKSDNEIAEELCISPLTVKTHRQNLLKILHLKKATSLTKFCVENGLI